MTLRRIKWKHIIREAHRIWVRRMAAGGAMQHATYSALAVPAYWNRRRSY